MESDLHVSRLFNPETQRLRPYFATDFLAATNAAAVDPFLGTAVASGTSNQPNILDANHPGVIRLLSSTSANSGYLVGTNTAQILLGGGEVFECIFQIDTFPNNTARIGFHDASSITAPTDAAMIEVDTSGVATGKTYNNTATSSTGTTLQLVAQTWYRARIELNADATLVTFKIFDMNGVLLWSDTLSANIPTGASRFVGAGFLITNALTTAITLAHIDYMSLYWKRQLVRGGA